MDFIGAMFKEVWGIDELRGPQRQAVEFLAVQGARVLVVAKTGLGKSAIPLGVLALLCGVAFVLVPLIGLGADQMARAMEGRGVVAYHLDELSGKKKQEVIAKLSSLKPGDPTMFVVYASPQSLLKGGGWYELLGTLIDNKTLSLLCFDEYHTGDWGRPSFRPEITALKENVFDRIPPSLPVLAMTGTLNKAIMERNGKMFGLTFDHVLWSSTSRRDIRISVFPQATTAAMLSTMKRALARNLKSSEQLAIVYSAEKKRVRDSLTQQLGEMLRSQGSDQRAYGVTGDTPMLLKNLVIADITSGGGPRPLNIGVVAATSTLGCGVNAELCSIVVHFGLTMSLVEYLQEMSRAGRKPLPDGAEFVYENCCTFSHVSFTLLARRAFGKEVVCKDDRVAMLDDLMEVLRFFALPGKCQHVLLEHSFRNPSAKRRAPPAGGVAGRASPAGGAAGRAPTAGGAARCGADDGVLLEEVGEVEPEEACVTQCAFCTGFYAKRKGVQQIAVVGALDLTFREGWSGATSVIDALWKSKEMIWGTESGTIFKRDAVFLYLQLVGSEMLEFKPGVLREGAGEHELPPLLFTWKMQAGGAGRMQLRSVPLKMHQQQQRWKHINLRCNDDLQSD